MKILYVFLFFSLILLNCSLNPDLVIAELETANDFDLLVDQVDSDNWQIREAAIIELGHILDKRAVPYLIQALKDDHPSVRVAAIESLRLYNSEKIIQHIIERLADKSPIVRIYAMDALGVMKGKEIASTIYNIYHRDSNKYVKKWAVFVLKKMKAWKHKTKVVRKRVSSNKPGFAKRKRKKKKRVKKRKKHKSVKKPGKKKSGVSSKKEKNKS